jgi:ribonuclease inhibitor
MRRYTLDGHQITSRATFYDQLSTQLQLPEHFGRNLDALWDTLTGDIEGPLKLVWKHAKASQRAMPEDYEKLAELLQAVAKERDDFTIEFK